MTQHVRYAVLAGLVLAAVHEPGLAQNPHAAPPARDPHAAMPSQQQPQAPGGARVLGGLFYILSFVAPLSTSWQPQPPTSSYRAAQFRVPGAGDGGDGEIVVFYFGKGQGGSAAANIERWTSQFTTPEGKPVKPKLELITVAGLPATLVELNGNYSRNVGVGPQGQGKPNQTLLVAIIETHEGNVTFQLHGDRQTVAANRKAFDAMVRGFKRAS